MNAFSRRWTVTRRIVGFCLILASSTLWPQNLIPKPPTPAPQPEAPKDTLGRGTPKGTVLGFLAAARKGNAEIAALYLNTDLRGQDAELLARQLALVLDQRLPARLNQLSEKPEGSQPNPLNPDEDLVGTIGITGGNLDITVERVERGKSGKVWLFSRQTLQSIPAAFQELNRPTVDKLLPDFLIHTRIATIPLFQWLALLVGMPFFYFVTGLLDRTLRWIKRASLRRASKVTDITDQQLLPPAVRLIFLSLFIRWSLSFVGLTLLQRQVWSTISTILAIIGCTWLAILSNGRIERFLSARLRRRNLSGSTAVLRLGRRVVDVLVLFSALLFALYHFGVDPTAALAGLGVGGIAIALAAQKTLENIIAGVSLIADQAVHVGDVLKVDDFFGTVEDVGLRSTRIRTLDRTLVTVPNSQIGNMSLETFSARDMFRFHPSLRLRYETRHAQLCSITAALRKLLIEKPYVKADSVRVRFLRIGTSSLDVDLLAYVYARDWNDFLAIQEDLLLEVMMIVQQSGAELALPSRMTYITANESEKRRLTIPKESVPSDDEQKVHQ